MRRVRGDRMAIATALARHHSGVCMSDRVSRSLSDYAHHRSSLPQQRSAPEMLQVRLPEARNDHLRLLVSVYIE